MSSISCGLSTLANKKKVAHGDKKESLAEINQNPFNWLYFIIGKVLKFKEMDWMFSKH